MGDHLTVTTAHEIGHAFQRQYTTNISTKWNDEASAGWVAWEATGNAVGMKPVIEGRHHSLSRSLYPAALVPGMTPRKLIQPPR